MLHRRKGSSHSGFTLVELSVVLAIVVLLAAAVVVGAGPIRARSRIAATMRDGQCLQSALQSFAATHPPSPAPGTMTSYAELAAFGRDYGCRLPAETDALYEPRPWLPLDSWCILSYRGKFYDIPCPPWPIETFGGFIYPVARFSGNRIAEGAEIALRVRGVEDDAPGAVVLVSSAGVTTLSVAEYQRHRSELSAAP